MKFKLLIFFTVIVALAVVWYQRSPQPERGAGPTSDPEALPTDPHPYSIQSLKQREFPGSEIVIEQTLDTGRNYQRYLASYQSDGLKIYGLLTVPNGRVPASGFPAIVFNHGSIPPA